MWPRVTRCNTFLEAIPRALALIRASAIIVSQIQNNHIPKIHQTNRPDNETYKKYENQFTCGLTATHLGKYSHPSLQASSSCHSLVATTSLLPLSIALGKSFSSFSPWSAQSFSSSTSLDFPSSVSLETVSSLPPFCFFLSGTSGRVRSRVDRASLLGEDVVWVGLGLGGGSTQTS